MRVFGFVVLLVAFLFGCDLSNAASESSKPGDQLLFDSLNAAYQPLKSCVDQKLSASGKSRRAIYSEIVASGLLPQVLLEQKEFLGTPRANVLVATNTEHVRMVIEALERAEPYATEKSYMYRTFGLRRQIAATSIIARSPSIKCGHPRELGYWTKEAEDYEILTNLWTFSVPFLECEDKYEKSIGRYGYSEQLASAIVQADKLPELRKMSSEYLAPSNPFVLAASNENMTDAMRVRALFSGLGRYEGSGSNDDRYGVKVRRLMVTISLKRIVASATQSKCASSPALTYWIKEVTKRRYQE